MYIHSQNQVKTLFCEWFAQEKAGIKPASDVPQIKRLGLYPRFNHLLQLRHKCRIRSLRCHR